MNIKIRGESKTISNKIVALVIAICVLGLLIFLEATKDKEPPIITIKENNLFFYDVDDINYLDYVEVSDNSDIFEVNVIDEDNAKLPGERQVQIEAKDKRGNVTDAYLDVKIIDTAEWNEYVADRTNHYNRRRSENIDFEELKGVVDYDAFHLAEEFVGMGGGCNVVAQAFIDAYFGEGFNIFDTYSVSKEEAKPGDVIFYTNGGLGDHHYAVYLGGSSALQGNIYGTTVLGSVYMTYGTEPQFQRLNGK